MVMRFSGLDLNLLIALNALLEERSVTKAAQRLNSSQPAMSSALGKLRDFFGDELLVRVGRDMLPTAQAEFLQRPIAEVLAAIQNTMRAKPVFDPSTESRKFRVMMSDYMATIILPNLIERLRRDAPSIKVDVVPSDDTMLPRLEKGEIDLGISPEKYLSPDHPSAFVAEDGYVVVVDRSNKEIGEKITLEQYLAADHVVVKLSEDRSASFEDWFLEHVNVSRNYIVSVPIFSMVPSLIANTSMIATMHSMLANRLKQNFPIRLVEVPGSFPKIKEMVQWHRLRDHDLGLAWFRKELLNAAQKAANRNGAVKKT